MKNKILVLGKGFLGKAFEKKGFEVWGKDKFEFKQNGEPLYLNKFKQYDAGMYEFMKHDVIINCVGKSNTRWCENPENWKETLFVNGEIPKILSEFCRREGKKFVHISTGCFYDKNDTLKREDDNLAIATHCNYTLTKLVGEKFCNLEKDLITRPRLYFGDFEDRNNLLCKIQKFPNFLVEQNSYTSVHVIVDAVSALLEAEQTGIFNVGCDGFASIEEMASWIGLPSREKITEKELHEKEGLYLVNNTMDITKLQKFYQPPKLKDEIIRCWSELKK